MKALLFRQWSPQVLFLSNGIEFSAAELAKLTDAGITIVPGEVSRLAITDDRLTGVMLDDGTMVELDALAVSTWATARLDGLDELGVDTTENAAGISVVADATGHTSVPGVWGAGNVVNSGMQVSEAAANGGRVAMMINTEMIFGPIDPASMAHSSEKSA